MKTDSSLEDLAKEFDNARAALTGKRLVYPSNLRRKVAEYLNTGIRPNVLAKELGISRSAIDSWKKVFSTDSSSPLPDFIPLKSVPRVKSDESATIPSKVSLRVISIDIPLSSLNYVLSETLSAIGVGQ